jgi:sirohydrochlorin ferrochelatase
MTDPTALVLIAHGSRQPEANADLHDLARQLRAADRYAVIEPAFLELAEPTIETAGRACVAGGARRVVLVPYFLSAGVHVRRDLRDARDRLAAAFPHVEFLLAGPLGPHPLLLDILTQRAREAEDAGPTA